MRHRQTPVLPLCPIAATGLPNRHARRAAASLAGVNLLFALAACGGDGGAAPPPLPPPPAAVTLSGSAAAGLPLTGNVTVKDALGASKTVAIGTNGSYSVDVSGMTSPLLLRAEGFAGTQSYVIHSAALSADASATVNITALTDLVVANAAGQMADAYFAGGQFASLSAADMATESAALKARLLPVLVALGVEPTIDLLRTPFTPAASALDNVLDLVRVSVDAASHTATLTNLVNQIAITDDLAVKAAVDGAGTPLSGEGLAGVGDDLTAIRTLFSDVATLFATSLPLPAQLLPYLSEHFLTGDVGRTDFANAIVTDDGMVGTRFTDIQIESISPAQAGQPARAAVHFIHRSAAGQGLSLNSSWLLQKDSDGLWRLHGDQALLAVSGGVHQVLDSVGGCRASGIEFEVVESDDANSASIHHVRITGPALPANGLEYRRAAPGEKWPLVAVPGLNPTWYPMTDSCSTKWGAAGLSDEAIAAIADQALYTARAFAADGSELPLRAGGGSFPMVSPKRPMTLAELKLATFPQVSTSAPLAGYLGGEFTVSGSQANGANAVWMYLGLTDSLGAVGRGLGRRAAHAGRQFQPRLQPAAGQRCERARMAVGSMDAYWRMVMTLEER